MNLGSIVSTVRNILPWTKQQPELTREQAMGARPIRNPSLRWRENEDGYAVIVLPRRTDWIGKLMSWFFMVPQARPIVLSDDVATFVWLQCNGNQTVEAISKKLQEEYQLGKREAELSLTKFLKMLGKRGMVGMMLPDEIARDLGDEQRDLLGLEDIGPARDAIEPEQKSSRTDR